MSEEPDYPEITAQVQDLVDEDGFICGKIYTRGSLKLEIHDAGEITVKSGDSLSLYSKILYDDFFFYKQELFIRKQNGEDKSIEPKSLIKTGETLYHVPTSVAHKKRVQGILNPPQPRLPTVTLPPPSWTSELNRLVTGKHVITVGSNDPTLDMIAGWTWGELRFHDVGSFVIAVQQAASTRRIGILHIYAHATASGVWFGPMSQSTLVNAGSFVVHQGVLGQLKGVLHHGAWVMFHSCNFGNALSLMRAFRSVWGANIVAGMGNHSTNGPMEWNQAGYQVVMADGTEFQMAYLPMSLRNDYGTMMAAKTSGVFF